MNELVIHNVEDNLLNKLHQNVAQHGISVEDEVKNILNSVIEENSRRSVLSRVRAIRKRNEHLQKTNTLDLLREDRDNR